MAITSLIIPSSLAPVYNPFVVVFESDNVTESNFRFIVELKDALNGDALIQRFNVAPRYPDNIGYQDISNVCQNLVSYQVPDGTNYNDGNLGSYAKVKIEVGELYSLTYAYTDIQDNSGYVELVGIGVPTYIAGDQIVITQSDGGVAMPNMEGLFTVLSVSGNDVTINRLWADITYSMIGGDVVYADNRKTEFPNLADEEVEFVNASFDFTDFQSYNEADWIQTDTTDGIEELWTDCNKYGVQTVKPTQDFFATVYHNFAGGVQEIWIRTTDSDGNLENYYYDTSIAEPLTQIRLMGDFGAINTNGGSTLPVIKDDTQSITIRWGRNGVGDPGSVYYTFNIDHRCTINDYEIMFLDLKGAWSSFAFQLKDIQTIKALKKSYKRELGTVANTGFSYELNDSGTENFYAKRDIDYVLTSNWMTEENSLYFDQLISSPKTFIKIDDVYYACEVTTTETQRERFQNKHMINKTINVKLANSQRVNG